MCSQRFRLIQVQSLFLFILLFFWQCYLGQRLLKMCLQHQRKIGIILKHHYFIALRLCFNFCLPIFIAFQIRQLQFAQFNLYLGCSTPFTRYNGNPIMQCIPVSKAQFCDQSLADWISIYLSVHTSFMLFTRFLFRFIFCKVSKPFIVVLLFSKYICNYVLFHASTTMKTSKSNIKTMHKEPVAYLLQFSVRFTKLKDWGYVKYYRANQYFHASQCNDLH